MNEIIKVPQSLDELERTGRLLAMSGYFDAKGTSEMAIAQVCTKILAGREMGYGPFASAQGIHIIQGRPAVSANLMAAAVKAHPAYDYRVRQMDDKACSIEFFQRVDGKWESLGSSAFTADDARKAQTKNMDKFPRNMLFARAMSNGVKWFCPDVFAGNAVYVPEELGATVDGEGNVIDVDHRSVDKATGEVLSTTPQEAVSSGTNGNANAVSEKQLRAMFALGTKVYGKSEWEGGKRAALVSAVTKKRTDSAAELTKDEASIIIDGLKRKEAELEAVPAHDYDNPFEDDHAQD